MSESIQNHSQTAGPKADGNPIRRFAPIAAVAVAGVLIGAVAVGVSQQIAGKPHSDPTVEATTPVTPAQRDVQVSAFAAKMNVTIKSKFEAGKGLDVVSYTSGEGNHSGPSNGPLGGIFYHLPDGSFVAGQLFDPAGTLLTEAHFKQAWPDGPPTPESTADVAKALESIDPAAMTTVVKNGAPELYMIYEPHCGFCKKSHEMLKDQNVTVHYLPVAFLTQDSEALVAAMLKGGPGMMDKISDPALVPKLIAQYQGQAAEVRPLIEKNSQVMRLSGAQGTPVFLWKGKEGSGGVQRGFLDSEGMQKMLAQVAADQATPVAVSGPPAAATN